MNITHNNDISAVPWSLSHVELYRTPFALNSSRSSRHRHSYSLHHKEQLQYHCTEVRYNIIMYGSFLALDDFIPPTF